MGGGWWAKPIQPLPQGLVLTFEFDPDPELDNILESHEKKKILRDRTKRTIAVGPEFFPSNEEITNAMWLSKIKLNVIDFHCKHFLISFRKYRHPRH